MKLRTIFATLAIVTLVAGVAYAAGKFTVTASEFDPARTFLVQAQWLDGIGCPTNAKVSADGSTTTPYTDLACQTGDMSDNTNQGLLLVKTGPTGNYAAAGADITGVKGITLTELGYDIRTGSHCGAGAPRFNVTTSDGFWFVGCSSPPGTIMATSPGWMRLRWSPVTGYKDGVLLSSITGTVKSIEIVFDEGQDLGADSAGSAILDNINVNGTLVGHGDNAGTKPGKGKDKGDDNNNGNNGNNGDKGERGD